MKPDNKTAALNKVHWLSISLLVCLLLIAGLYQGAMTIFGVVLFIILTTLAIYDWQERRLPNTLTAALAMAGIFYFSLMPVYGIADHIIGGLVGLTIFPLINAVYRRIRGRDGIGMGDAKLLGALGLWFAWPALPFLLLLGSVGGLFYALLISVTKKGINSRLELPFGTFLCLAAWFLWLIM